MSASRFQARLAPKAQVVNFTNNNSINNNKTAETDVAGDAKAERKMKREECICNRGQKVTKRSINIILSKSQICFGFLRSSMLHAHDIDSYGHCYLLGSYVPAVRPQSGGQGAAAVPAPPRHHLPARPGGLPQLQVRRVFLDSCHDEIEYVIEFSGRAWRLSKSSRSPASGSLTTRGRVEESGPGAS